MDKHYDAAGHPTYDRTRLLEAITHEPSRAILRSSLHARIIVIPCVSIRVYLKHPETVEVIRHGTGPQISNTYEVSPRALQALRKTWKDATAKGWSKRVTALYCELYREARVIRDPLRRFF